MINEADNIGAQILPRAIFLLKSKKELSFSKDSSDLRLVNITNISWQRFAGCLDVVFLETPVFSAMMSKKLAKWLTIGSSKGAV